MSVFEAAIQLAFWGPIVLFSIGVPAALCNVIIFISVKAFRQSPAIYYVIGQSLADVSVLLIVLLQIVPSVSIYASSTACKLAVFFTEVTVCTAMSFLCLTAFDRWACTSQSALVRQLSSNCIARRLFSLPFVLWSLASIPFLIYTDLVPPTFACSFTSELFVQFVGYFYTSILAVVLPLLVLITFSALTYRNIGFLTNVRRPAVRNRRSMWEQQMTRMMLAQTLLSIACTLPRAIFILYTIATVSERATRSFDRLSIELLLDQLSVFINCANYTSSFYIYILISPRLRQTIKLYFKRLMNLEHNQIGHTNIPSIGISLTARQIPRETVNPSVAIEEVE